MPETFVYHPDYSPVAAYSTRDNTIPSGATIVQGIYYKWNDDGFTGNGWKLDIAGGPTAKYGFQSDEEVLAHIASEGNLDDVFYQWSLSYSIDDWNAFYNAVGFASGCMDVRHATGT